jgi:LysM repeat protein
MQTEEREGQRRSWRGNVILTAGIIVTVLLGFILAQLDALQARAVLDVPGLPVINIQATAIAIGQLIRLDTDPEALAAVGESLAQPLDDLNPRPEFITGVSEEGVIFTVCGEVPEGWLLYTVQPGETLASLAAGTGMATADLAGANCLTEGQLTAGMQILVPQQPAVTLCGPPQWWARYQVQPGDSVASLAAERGTTVEEVLRANCRDSLDLQSGQMIFLPSASQSVPGATPAPQPSLTPLPPPTAIPTLAPLPSATSVPTAPPPPPTAPSFPTPIPTMPVPVPTVTPPPLPTDPPPQPTDPPPVLPTNPPPTVPPPTIPPPSPTNPPPPTDPPPEPTNPPPVPTDPPPLPTDPPPQPTDPPPDPTDPPPVPSPTDPPPTDPPP